MTDLAKILEANEAAVSKWSQPPKLARTMGLKDHLRLWHDTKRFFIVRALQKLQKTSKNDYLSILDYGSGQGGITIDVQTYLGLDVSVKGYDVSPTTVAIAQENAKKWRSVATFITDSACNLIKAVEKSPKFDAVISCDVFGHVPSIPVTFKEIYEILTPGGQLIAFSESITGARLTIPTYLAKKGFSMDDSAAEHISLHSIKDLKRFMEDAGFTNVKVYPFDPIRFPFYPKRYVTKLRQCNKLLYVLAKILALFQNPITELVYNQFNLILAKHGPWKDTAGCFILGTKPRRH